MSRDASSKVNATGFRKWDVTTSGPDLIAIVFPIEGLPQIVTTTQDEATHARILEHIQHNYPDWARVLEHIAEVGEARLREHHEAGLIDDVTDPFA